MWNGRQTLHHFKYFIYVISVDRDLENGDCALYAEIIDVSVTSLLGICIGYRVEQKHPAIDHC